MFIYISYFKETMFLLLKPIILTHDDSYMHIKYMIRYMWIFRCYYDTTTNAPIITASMRKAKKMAERKRKDNFILEKLWIIVRERMYKLLEISVL